jgi:branched-chain amino acid transport system ATP-binding protein
MTSPLLRVEQLQAGYGASQVLFDINFELAAGEVITLLGRNGMGKSTTVKCLCGLLKPRSGQIHFAGQATHNAPPHVIGQLGMGLVPEGRQVFPTLTVRENLVATASARHVQAANKAQQWTLERVQQLFPRLKERATQLAGKMSGGEQQMLAVGRALMTNPKLVILDEATEGLAPLIRQEIWQCLQVLKNEGQAMIVIDKNLNSLIPLAKQHYVIEKGKVVWSGGREQIQAQRTQVEALLKA